MSLRSLLTLACALLALALAPRALHAQSTAATAPPAHDAPTRVLDVEDYLTRHVQEYLTDRFPQRPYSVVVHVTPLRDSNGSAEHANDAGVSLPFMQAESSRKTGDDWARKDVPITDLLGKIKKIEVSLNVPNELTDEEISVIRHDLSSKLRLEASRDSLSITKRNWSVAAASDRSPASSDKPSLQKKFSELGIEFFLSIALVLLGLAWLWYVSRSSIARLVSGLGSALSDIWSKVQDSGAGAGRNLAAASTAEAEDAGARRPAKTHDEETRAPLDPLQARAAIKELVSGLKDFFANPQVDLLDFVEEEGAKQPRAVGAALLEFDQAIVQGLFTHGSGDWWFTALLDPEAPSERALAFLERVANLRNRRQFDSISSLAGETRKLALLLARLDADKLEGFFASYSFDDSHGALALLRASKAIAVAKKVFPEHWPRLLDGSKAPPLPDKLALSMCQRAVSLKPAREGEQIRDFFRDLDLRQYLDLASPGDEREVYLVLSPESAIVRSRLPFYEVLALSPAEITQFVGIVDNEEWAMALAGIGQAELAPFLDRFSERQRYFLSERLAAIASMQPKPHQIRQARRKVVHTAVSLKLITGNAKVDAPETKAAA